MKRLLFCLLGAALPLLCGCGHVYYVAGTPEEPIAYIDEDPGYQYGVFWNTCGYDFWVEPRGFKFEIQRPDGTWDTEVSYIELPAYSQTERPIRLKPNDPRYQGREVYWLIINSPWTCYSYPLVVNGRKHDSYLSQKYDWDVHVEFECRPVRH